VRGSSKKKKKRKEKMDVQAPVMKMPQSNNRKSSNCNPAFDMVALKESLAMAEIKAAASSSGRKLSSSRKLSNEQNLPYVPPKQLLMYLVRMGSFTAIPKAKGEANPDEDLDFPETTIAQLLARCRGELSGLPSPFQRSLRPTNSIVGKGKSRPSLRVLQWNQLSQTLGTQNDGFVRCPLPALEWRTRRWRLLEELVRHQPDILCLQEVDHFPLIERALSSLGYDGHFVAKPDSPCIYLPSNSGPDGCALFYRRDQWELVGQLHSRILEVWHVQSNQVAIAANLRHLETQNEVCVATTHLKARSGALLATLRNEQGKDLLAWLSTVKQHRPLILTGDFNADPSEAVVRTIKEELASAYPDSTPFTTWKIRETGEQKSILDYIFHSAGIQASATLDMPTEQQIGIDRLPSAAFPSDHLSMVADLTLV